jgi:hypothetical protein
MYKYRVYVHGTGKTLIVDKESYLVIARYNQTWYVFDTISGLMIGCGFPKKNQAILFLNGIVENLDWMGRERDGKTPILTDSEIQFIEEFHVVCLNL